VTKNVREKYNSTFFIPKENAVTRKIVSKVKLVALFGPLAINAETPEKISPDEI